MSRAMLLICSLLYLVAGITSNGPMRAVMLSYAVANVGLAYA